MRRGQENSDEAPVKTAVKVLELRLSHNYELCNFPWVHALALSYLCVITHVGAIRALDTLPRSLLRLVLAETEAEMPRVFGTHDGNLLFLLPDVLRIQTEGPDPIHWGSQE